MSAVPADTYLSFILSRPLFEVWNLFLLGLARVVPAIAIAPFLGGKSVSDPIKIGFGVAVTIIFLPYLIVTAKGPVIVDYMFILLLLKEALLGSLMGFLIAIPFYWSQSAGALIDHQRGSQSLQVQDPMTQSQTSPTGTFYSNMMLVIFFASGGVLFFFDALFSSYDLVPVNQFLNARFFEVNNPLWLTILDLVNIVVKVTLQLSAPAVLTMLLSDLFLGIANRMAPQVQITFLLYSLKSFTGIGMLWVAWFFVLKQLDVEMLSWFKLFQKIVETF